MGGSIDVIIHTDFNGNWSIRDDTCFFFDCVVQAGWWPRRTSYLLGPKVLAALNLDGAQQAEMDTIDEEEEALLDEAYQKAAENMESLKLLEKEMILESRSVLTAEQITELRKMMQERMESRQGP